MQQIRHTHRYTVTGVAFVFLMSLFTATLAPNVANATGAQIHQSFNVHAGSTGTKKTVTIMVESTGDIGTFDVSASVNGATSQKTISTVATNFSYKALQIPNVAIGSTLRVSQADIVNPDNGYWNSANNGEPVWSCVDGNNRKLAVTSTGRLVVNSDVVCTALNTFTLKKVDAVPSDTPTPCNCKTNNAAMVKILPDTGGVKSQKPTRINRKVIGWLTVPSINIKGLKITYGVDKPNLNTGVAGAYTFAKPGDYGVFAIAAHRLGGGGPFRHLDKVKVGDKVIVYTTKNTYTYQVITTQLVLPTNTSILDGPTYQQRVVLITCTPMMVWSHRIIVTAVLIDSQ